MIKSQRLTVTSTPALANYPEAMDSIKGQVIAINNLDESVSVYLGGEDVTTDNGYELAAGGQISVDLNPIQDLYIVSSGSVEVSFLYIDVK